MGGLGIPELLVILGALVFMVVPVLAIIIAVRWIVARQIQRSTISSKPCKNCGQQIPDLGTFCPLCGQRLA